MKEVELHSAFFFDCDNCGRTVFLIGDRIPKDVAIASADKKDRAFLKKYFKNEDSVPAIPDMVKCPFEDCGAEFTVAQD